jgi:hypothetical protein
MLAKNTKAKEQHANILKHTFTNGRIAYHGVDQE